MGYFFSYAFRPMFLLAIVYGILAVCWWSVAWQGFLPLPGHWSNPVLWHAHEMVFGFAGAGVAGFSLTAVANWTGRPPVSGVSLVILSLLWLSARISALGTGPWAAPITAVTDIGFDLLLCALMAREVIAARNQRNYKLVALLALFALSNTLFFVAEQTAQAWTSLPLWAGVFLLAMLLNLIAGRIIPAFTGNWLVQRAQRQQGSVASKPPGFAGIDRFATGASACFFVAWLIQPQSVYACAIGAIATLGQLLRWCRWQGYRTLSSPIVWVLHLAFLWLPAGIALLACNSAGLIPASAGLHALTSGAFGTMILAVAGRAALGHSNRPLENNPWTTASYVAITLSAALRVAASLSPAQPHLLELAALCWILALSLFARCYLPILLKPPLSAA